MFRKSDKERLIAIEDSLLRLHARVDTAEKYSQQNCEEAWPKWMEWAAKLAESIQRVEQGQNVLKADLDAIDILLNAIIESNHKRSKSSHKPKRKRR